MGEYVLKKQMLSAMLIFAVSLSFLNGCSFQQNSHQSSKKTANPQKLSASTAGMDGNWKFPIAVPDGEFFKVGGWLSNRQLLYITNKGQSSSLYSYDLVSGRSSFLFKSEYPIGDIQISPARKYILIQASVSSNEAKVTVIDTKGNEKYSQLIPSYELSFEWNPYSESEVLVSTFQEDWTFKVSLLDIKRKMLTPLSLPQPFMKWVNQREIAYLNWNSDSQTLFAPLIIHSLTNGKEESLFPSVFQFSAFKNKLMTITVNGKAQTRARYSFFTPKLQLITSFEIPLLKKDSDWLVPFYDYNEKRNVFLTFRPLKSTSADTYTEGFQLTLYNLVNGKGTVLLKGLDNEPLSFSPSGTACLYGNSFEKIIDLSSKKIISLVKEQK